MQHRNKQVLYLAALVSAATVFACAAATGDTAKEGKGKKGAASAASDSAAAVIGDKTITMAELDAKAAGALVKVRQDEYEARRQVLESLINDEIMAKEAAAKSKTKEELTKAEITDKVPEPAQADVDAFYEQNKARFGAQTKEQLAPQITAMLKNQKMADTQRAYYKSLRDKYGVKTMLEPPRVQVALDDDPVKGPAKAPITIVEFSDYQCPYCSRAETTVTEVLKKYGDKIRLVYRDYPLSFHQNANVAAQASECAEEQGKFWEMHGAMFANQSKLAATDLVETAATIGLEKDKFKACLDSGKYKDEVQKDFEDGQKAGVTGTPTFFINGIPMVGARDVNSFAEIIDTELERSK
ncbi:MAG TPA: thioredoxin domain-containing protein [Candidatus Polarisedimenticolia bacterium]|jgi:protein-disulfide isomerase|nr:thioredoxin domain-containing protein [Candidatus Polarisedimenticolia bacterium]